MNFFGSRFWKCSYSHSFRKSIKKPSDILVKEKLEPKNAISFDHKPDIIETVYKQIVHQPRSKLKLPVNDLIKIATVSNHSINSTSIERKSDADTALERLRDDSSGIVPRLDTIHEVAKALASEGSWEKAESLILNMKEDYGVEPSQETLSFLALAYLNGGKRGSAIKCLSKIPEWGLVAQTMYKYFLSDALKRGESEKAENLFSIVRSRCLPSPEIIGLMLMNYGKTGRIEMGMRLYKEIVESGMEPNAVTHAAMIYLCTRSKSHFDHAVGFYEQMKVLAYPIHLRVHNYMLQGCGKVSDIGSAVSIWNDLLELSVNDKSLQPNEFTLSSILWALASAETPETKLSKREFHYNVDKADLVMLASEIFTKGCAIIKPNSHICNAYLAVLTDNLSVQLAEDFFHNQMVGEQAKTEHSYELMFKMYDSLRDLPKTKELKSMMDGEKLITPFEGWRAMIRTAALSDELVLALEWLQEMNDVGYKPSVEDLKVLKLRIFEMREFDHFPKFHKLCLPEPKPAKKLVAVWRDRSAKIDEFFQKVYGEKAPKLATKIENK